MSKKKKNKVNEYQCKKEKKSLYISKDEYVHYIHEEIYSYVSCIHPHFDDGGTASSENKKK